MERMGEPKRDAKGCFTGDRLDVEAVEDGLWRCRRCAGLLFASQGRYRRQLERAVFDGVYGPGAHVREPLPRHPWDPQVVSDPRLVVERFHGALVEGSAAGRQAPTRHNEEQLRVPRMQPEPALAAAAGEGRCLANGDGAVGGGRPDPRLGSWLRSGTT